VRNATLCKHIEPDIVANVKGAYANLIIIVSGLVNIYFQKRLRILKGGCIGELNHRKFWLMVLFHFILIIWTLEIVNHSLFGLNDDVLIVNDKLLAKYQRRPNI